MQPCIVPLQLHSCLSKSQDQRAHDPCMVPSCLCMLPVASCRYTGIHIGPPCLEEEYRQEEITPQQCRLRDITYAGGAQHIHDSAGSSLQMSHV